jgi:hypothetical protein
MVPRVLWLFASAAAVAATVFEFIQGEQVWWLLRFVHQERGGEAMLLLAIEGYKPSLQKAVGKTNLVEEVVAEQIVQQQRAVYTLPN